MVGQKLLTLVYTERHCVGVCFETLLVALLPLIFAQDDSVVKITRSAVSVFTRVTASPHYRNPGL